MRSLLGSSNQFSTWPLVKKYSAARYYLEKTRFSSINEAQWSRLHALELQILYGGYIPDARVPEFQNCSEADRRRRETEWKNLRNLSRIPAMQQFIDIMNDLFPNWCKQKSLYEEFEFEWMQGERNHRRTESRDFHPMKKVTSSLKLERRKEGHKERQTRSKLQVQTTAAEDLLLYDSQRITSASPKLPKLSARLDAEMTLHSFKTGAGHGDSRDAASVSKYYHLTSPHSPRQEEDLDRVRSVLETYFGSINSGRLSSISEKKPVFDLKNDMESTLSQMVKRLDMARTARVKQEDVQFPLVTAEELEGLLRSKLEVPIMVLTHLEEVFTGALNAQKPLLSLLRTEFTEAVDSLFSYLIDSEHCRKDVGRQAEALEFELGTTLKTLSAIERLYNKDVYKSETLDRTKTDQSEYQLEVSRGLAILKGDSERTIKELEACFRAQEKAFFSIKSRLTDMTVERDKLVDQLKLIQQSAYTENIYLGNMVKDLKRSVGIIQGGEGRGSTHEFAFKKEIEELKSEIRLLQTKNEDLKRRQTDRRFSIRKSPSFERSIPEEI